MAQMNVPAQEPTYTTVYNNFKGVDLSSDASLVDKSRSPFAPNLISDIGGMPEKRVGWRTIHTLEQPINGMFYGNINDENVYIAHGGTKLYKWTDTSFEVIKENLSNSKSTAFFMEHESKGKMWLLTGNDYLVYDGTEFKEVKGIATIPVIIISREPSGGGTPLEPINLLQSKRTEKFLPDGSAKIYQLSAKELDEELVTVKQMLSSGEVELKETTNFTVNRTTGVVTFIVAPPKGPVTGEDSIYITYSKTTENYAKKIKECTIFAYYGIGGSNRIFLTGNPSYKSHDFWSEINDPTYFPDLSYSIVGSENTAIMGYCKIGEYLAIVKEDNQQDSTIFLRNAVLQGEDALFPLKQGVAGTGAIAKYCFVNLIDEPLFLSRTGVYAITSNVVTAERTLQNRSFFIDGMLTKEQGLQDAVAVEWNGYYIIAVNGRAYVLDGKQSRAYKSQTNGDFVYECYTWFNIPAICFLQHNGSLYFGTVDGKICKFNTDVNLMTRFNDDNLPVSCAWATKNDNDGTTNLLKNLTKKGCYCTIKPYSRSSAKVFFSVDGNEQKQIKYETMDILDWEDIDFSRFTFNSNESPQEIFFKKKVKKYKRLQIIIKNDSPSEGFGIFEIGKVFTKGNLAKR